MNKYVKEYSQLITENFQQFGVVLIKGKPQGKGQPVKLFAAHVMSTVEIRPGATMLLLSNIFYRIIQENGRLKAIKIAYGDDDNLKSALNFKTSGRPSVVKNNNKTPFHWRTLKYTDINQALSTVDRDLLGPDYLFESANTNPTDQLLTSFLEQFIISGIKDFVILNYRIPINALENEMDEESGSATATWDLWLDALLLVEGSETQRLDININFKTDFSWSGSTKWGGYQQPDELDQSIDEVDTEILDITLESGDLWSELSTDKDDLTRFNRLIIEWTPDDFEDYIKKKSQYLHF